MRAGPLYGDLSAGMAGAMGILAAVVARDRTGVGQHVDISMLDVQISMLSYIATMSLMSGLPAGRYGNEHALHTPYNAYECTDGYLFVAIVINAHWPLLTEALVNEALPDSVRGDVDYLRHDRLREHIARLGERTRINEALGRVLRTRPRDTWLRELSAAGIPVAPVNTLEEAIADEQVLGRDMIVDVPHPAGGSYRAPGNPIRMSAADPSSFSAPPRAGEDTAAVLRDVLGYDAAAIDELIAAGAVQRYVG
jgi:crotonobetainyl-CoA:carnitine CoA-transferase CaiB-like acyl-CoA transferase